MSHPGRFEEALSRNTHIQGMTTLRLNQEKDTFLVSASNSTFQTGAFRAT